MSFRNLEQGTDDWTFGNGKNNYVIEEAEILLNIKTRVLSFYNNCFFALEEGIDYFKLLDYNQQEKLELAIQQTIYQTPGVNEIVTLDIFITSERQFRVSYTIKTIYSTTLSDKFLLI